MNVPLANRRFKSSKILVAVAPNGARHSKEHHPDLPITAKELARVATDCLDAGAAMLHLHVRNSQGQHSLNPHDYEPALNAIYSSVGDKMLVQVTSEAAGIYDRHEQMKAMASLSPECVSIALREIIPDSSAWNDAGKFLDSLTSQGCLIQYIVYTPSELKQYYELVEQKIIPSNNRLLLFVLGHYTKRSATLDDLQPFLQHNIKQNAWMCCAFGPQEQTIMQQVATLQGHARVGFENNHQLADGTVVNSNQDLVRSAVNKALAAKRSIANSMDARALFSHTD